MVKRKDCYLQESLIATCIQSSILSRFWLTLEALYDPQTWSSASPLWCLEYWRRIVRTDGHWCCEEYPLRQQFANCVVWVGMNSKGRLIIEDPTIQGLLWGGREQYGAWQWVSLLCKNDPFHMTSSYYILVCRYYTAGRSTLLHVGANAKLLQ